MHIRQLFERLSVRARVAALGVVPIIGFLAYGIAYMASDIEVGRAFDSVRRDNAVVDASSDLKTGLLAMRLATVTFVTHPSDSEVKSFDQAQQTAMKSLDRIEATLTSPQQDVITPLRITVRDLKASFDSLVNAQRALGFNEMQGTTADLIAASAAIEHIINNELTWVGDHDSARLLESLLTMRRYEVEYRLSRLRFSMQPTMRSGAPAAEQHFLDEVKHFNAIFDSVDGPPAAKQKLNKAVQTYSYTFAQWVANTDNIEPLLSLIDHDTESVLPEADKIIATAQQNADVAANSLAASRARTQWIIAWVGFAFVMLGLLAGWAIGRSVTTPLEGLAEVMKRLAGGDTTARVPATDARHETGAMARAVVVFRDNMIERERLSGVQADANAARERRTESIAAMIGQFRTSVEAALARLRESASRLEERLERAQPGGRRGDGRSASAETRVGAASVNVTTVASSIEELRRLDRRDRHPGHQVDRSRAAARWPNPSAPSTPCRNWAAPPTASAR